jgi:Bacterial lectin
MKSAAISRLVIVAAIAALMVVGGSTPASAQCPASPNYPTGFSTNGTCLTPNSNAGIVASTSTVLRLTNPAGNQVGSAWYNTAQPVENGFSTSFQFRFTSPSVPPADGIAFVIQNAPTPLGAIGFTGGNGGAIGYGDADGNTNPSAGQGIPNSLAIEFDTFQNGWDPGPNGGSVSHVAIQSCGTGANTSHHTSLCGGNSGNSSNLGVPVSVANLADGAVHSVTVVYNLACPTCAPSTSSNNLHVILDNVDLYPLGVPVDLSSIGLGTGNTAYVGFTGATGGDFETQDILNWTVTLQAQSASLPAVGVQALLPFNGGTGNQAYDYNAVLTAGGITATTAQVQPILIDRNACNKLVQKKFPLAQCFVYQNAAPGKDSSVLFSLTCPGSSENGTCGDVSQDFFADLGSDFTFSKGENPGFQLLMATIGPYPGWLKGSGPDPLNPCVFDPNSTTPPFVSNQISSFSVVGDPLGTTKGKSGGGGSCWVATYFTPGEAPPGVKITNPTFATFHTSMTPGTANYTCSDPKTSKQLPPVSAVGPYLTAATCTQSQAPNNSTTNSCSANVGGVITCSGTFDLSTKGLHVFSVTSKDSGGNVGANAVIYNVVK